MFKLSLRASRSLCLTRVRLGLVAALLLFRERAPEVEGWTISTRVGWRTALVSTGSLEDSSSGDGIERSSGGRGRRSSTRHSLGEFRKEIKRKDEDDRAAILPGYFGWKQRASESDFDGETRSTEKRKRIGSERKFRKCEEEKGERGGIYIRESNELEIMGTIDGSCRSNGDNWLSLHVAALLRPLEEVCSKRNVGR